MEANEPDTINYKIYLNSDETKWGSVVDSSFSCSLLVRTIQIEKNPSEYIPSPMIVFVKITKSASYDIRHGDANLLCVIKDRPQRN